MAKTNKSKYNFGTLKVGDTRLIDGEDKFSMTMAARQFNRKHKTNIILKFEKAKSGKLLVTRIEEEEESWI